MLSFNERGFGLYFLSPERMGYRFLFVLSLCNDCGNVVGECWTMYLRNWKNGWECKLMLSSFQSTMAMTLFWTFSIFV